jgi:sulfur-carrier protein
MAPARSLPGPVGCLVVTAADGGAHETDEAERCVTVLFFAGAREAAGTGRTRARATGDTVEALLEDLCSTYGDGLRAVLATCAVWVNRSPAPRTTVLSDGDEVAVLPPVSGGCGTLGWQWP